MFGPIGEGAADWGGGGGVGKDEIGKLEADPSASVSNADFDDGSTSTFGEPNSWSGGTMTQDFSALRAVIPEPATTVMLVSLLAAFGLMTQRRR